MDSVGKKPESATRSLSRSTTGRIAFLAALAAAFIAGTVLRFAALGESCLWLDEIITAQTAMRGPVFIVKYTHQDTGPLFMTYFFEWATSGVGRSEFWVRFPTALFGSLSILLIGAATLQIGRDRIAAVLAAVLLAVCYHHIYYSREARGYALLVFLVLLSFILLHRSLERNRVGWWAAFTVASLAGLYTSYFYSFAQASLVLYAIGWIGYAWRRRQHDRRECLTRAAWLLGSCAVLGLLFLPWVVSVVNTFAGHAEGSAGSSPQAVWIWLQKTAREWFRIPTSCYIVPFALIAIGGLFGDRTRRGLMLAFLVFMIAFPVAFFLASTFVLFLDPRYLIAPLPFAIALFAIGSSWLGARLWEYDVGGRLRIAFYAARALAVLVVVAPTLFYSSVGLRIYSDHYRDQKQDWKTVAEFLRSNIEPKEQKDYIVPGVDATHLCLQHYLPEELKAIVTGPGSGDARHLAETARSGKRIWYVSPHYALRNVPAIHTWLNEHFTQVLVTKRGKPIYIFKGPKLMYP